MGITFPLSLYIFSLLSSVIIGGGFVKRMLYIFEIRKYVLQLYLTYANVVMLSHFTFLVQSPDLIDFSRNT